MLACAVLTWVSETQELCKQVLNAHQGLVCSIELILFKGHMYVWGSCVRGDGKSVMIFFCRQQNVEDFMDEDELELRQKSSVQTKAEYDTFGDTATELARKAAAADAHARPSLIPGPVFQDLIAPVPDSVGETHS